ncbi:hypothetical protein KJ763_00625 [Patescibacteria group bacterium]|nr:hypothetical protein [Patescibacteria group bacterium]
MKSIKIILPLLILIPVIVSAAGIVPCNGIDCTVCDLAAGIKKVIDVLLKDIAFPLTVIVFLYGGFMLIISRGSENNLNKGRKALWSAFWGILIAFGAWLIIDLILGNLIAPGYIPMWNQFPGC